MKTLRKLATSKQRNTQPRVKDHTYFTTKINKYLLIFFVRSCQLSNLTFRIWVHVSKAQLQHPSRHRWGLPNHLFWLFLPVAFRQDIPVQHSPTLIQTMKKKKTWNTTIQRKAQLLLHRRCPCHLDGISTGLASAQHASSENFYGKIRQNMVWNPNCYKTAL